MARFEAASGSLWLSEGYIFEIKEFCSLKDQLSYHGGDLVTKSLLLSLILLLSSCSLTGRSLLGSDDEPEITTKQKPVSREQYNQLLDKYESLNKQHQLLQAELNTMKGGTDQMLENSKLATQVDINETDDLKAKLNQLNSQSLDTTVAKIENAKPAGAVAATSKLDPTAIEMEIDSLAKAKKFIAQKRFNEAMQILKTLEASSHKQIRVRAKFQTGEILFKQQEFDLAMQIFEEVVTQDAFSGVVLKTLGRLVVCADKLKLKQKQEQYHSMLYDFFES
ncbi:MAG: tetratricopeptide repeat protein [Bacteriovoracaceae bacterium]